MSNTKESIEIAQTSQTHQYNNAKADERRFSILSIYISQNCKKFLTDNIVF